MTSITYEPKWSDGKARPPVTLKLASYDHKDGWFRGVTPEGASVGPVPDSWIVKIDP